MEVETAPIGQPGHGDQVLVPEGDHALWMVGRDRRGHLVGVESLDVEHRAEPGEQPAHRGELGVTAAHQPDEVAQVGGRRGQLEGRDRAVPVGHDHDRAGTHWDPSRIRSAHSPASTKARTRLAGEGM